MKKLPLKLLTNCALLSLLCIGSSSIWAQSIGEKIDSVIDEVTDNLQHTLEQLGDDAARFQEYLESHKFIADRATSGVATLDHMRLNGYQNGVVVKPGETIEGLVEAHLNRSQCTALALYRVVLGFKGIGAQTTICNYLGISAGDSLERFTLIAPQDPGIYQIRFRVVESLLESTALSKWNNEDGGEPDASTVVGLIVVKP